MKLNIRNTKTGYGLVARLLHWAMAIIILVMFSLGLWMTSLSFVSPWYHMAPFIHKSIGVLLFFGLVFRVFWRLINPRPDDSHLKPSERVAAHLVHWTMYGILFFLMASGYLISTLDGRPISVFGLFDMPSLLQEKALETFVGFIHGWIAYGLIALAGLHMLAALKHHFIDRDVTLKRMVSSPTKSL